MADDRLKQVRNRVGRGMLKSLAVSVEHIRTCPRCERLFLVAYEASADQSEENRPALAAPQMYGSLSRNSFANFVNVPTGQTGLKFQIKTRPDF